MEIFWTIFFTQKWGIFQALFDYQNSVENPQFWAQMKGLTSKSKFRNEEPQPVSSILNYRALLTSLRKANEVGRGHPEHFDRIMRS